MPSTTLPSTPAHLTYHPRARFLHILDEPWSLSNLTFLADLPPNPPIHTARDFNNPPTQYVEMSLHSRNLLAAYLVNASKRPLFFMELPIPAEKDLNKGTKTLGRLELGLPSWCNKPAQDEYPAPYFFYGTLADAEKLYAMLDLDEMPELREAKVKGGKIMRWGGKYRAMVNGKKEDEVQGKMFVVESKKQEEELLKYEGENYEVVRCKIEEGEDGEVVDGLTFRFCGNMSALMEEGEGDEERVDEKIV